MLRSHVRLEDIEVAYLHAEHEGAPKVVFVHGMAETAESCWLSQLVALQGDFDCYAYDIRGHGGTTLGDADATLEQLGSDLLEFLRGVTGPAVVVGFSLGATISLWAAAHSTGLILHVVAVGGSSVISSRVVEVFTSKADMIRRRDLLALHEEMRAEVTAMFSRHPERAEAYGARRIAAIGEGDGYANAALAMAGMRERPLQPDLRKIRCTVDIVGGGDDAWCPPRASAILLEGFDGGDVRFTEIQGAGHLMTIDTPEALSSLLRQVIDPPAGPARELAS